MRITAFVGETFAVSLPPHCTTCTHTHTCIFLSLHCTLTHRDSVLACTYEENTRYKYYYFGASIVVTNHPASSSLPVLWTQVSVAAVMGYPRESYWRDSWTKQCCNSSPLPAASQQHCPGASTQQLNDDTISTISNYYPDNKLFIQELGNTLNMA